ncbi:uncharacterized protein LOC141648163 [Silene latifolia]|uniref:uncharacterized protein LOC141648163 n=1 Tax=Silene latifolia TaxID=37657 RepID=UPI003D7822FB
MMNVIAPTIECNSGCESGWTLYLEHSTSNNISLTYKNTSFQGKKLKSFDEKQAHKDVLFYEQEDDDEEEDLSMVSDASSGPPHFDHDNIDEEVEDNNLYYYCNNNTNGKKRTMTLYNKANDDFALDDTASSHVFASKEVGGIRVQKNRGASLERVIDYSSQAYSGTDQAHAHQVVLEKRKSRR